MIGRLSVLVVAIVAAYRHYGNSKRHNSKLSRKRLGWIWCIVQSTCAICTLPKGLTRAGAVSGMVSGALVVIVWIAGGLNHLAYQRNIRLISNCNYLDLL